MTTRNIGKLEVCEECGHDINLHKGLGEGCQRTFSIGKATFKCVCEKCRIEFNEEKEISSEEGKE